MTPEEWPIWTPPERGGLSPALRAGRDRLPTVRADFFLNERFRLTEQERAFMTAMLHQLVADVAGEIHASLPEDWLPANEDHEGLLHRLFEARLLDIEGLIGLLVRRADEERVGTASLARSASTRKLIQPLVSDQDGGVAATAMAVLIARGRRRDRYGRALVELDDVDAESARTLVFAVAAGLRELLPAHVPVGEADARLSDAALSIIQSHNPSKSLDAALGRLVASLASAGRLNEDMLAMAIEAADLAFLAHALAHRANIDSRAAFDELLCQDGRRILMLLRLGNLSKPLTAQFLAMLGDFIGLSADTYALESVDGESAEAQKAARGWLQLDTGFQSALRHLGHGNGHSPR